LPEGAIVDSGPLYATLDLDDPDHARSVAALRSATARALVIPALVVAEVTYFAAHRLGADAEARFLEGLAHYAVVAPQPEDWRRMAELVREYADFPLGGTDASVVALAERMSAETVITLDRRHFSAIRPRHCRAFRLVPD
jgi:hypothetical protein